MDPRRRISRLWTAWLACLCSALLGVADASGGVLLLAHYNRSLDADVPGGKVGRATVRHVTLTSGGRGVAFADSMPSAEAADIGYAGPTQSDAAILRYEAGSMAWDERRRAHPHVKGA